MPKNWKTYKLGDFAEINPKVPLKVGEEHSFVEMKDLEPTLKYASPSAFREMKGGSKFQDKDTLFARITPCLENGKISQVKNLRNSVGFGSTEFLVFRGKEKISDTDFVYYLTRSDYVRNNAIQMMTGTSGRQRVEKSALQELEISAPDLKTQSRIASILSSLDDKIELNLQMNKTLEEMAGAMFKEYFNNKKTTELENYIDFNPRISIPKGKSAKFVEMADLNEQRSSIATHSVRKFGSGSKFLNNDTLLARITPCLENGKTGLVDFLKSGEVAFGSTEFIVMRAKKNVSPYYVYLLARNENFREFAIKSMVGTSGRQRVQTDLLMKFEVPIIDEVSMSTFHKMTTELFKKICTNTEEVSILTNIRDSLLPKLMTGKIEI